MPVNHCNVSLLSKFPTVAQFSIPVGPFSLSYLLSDKQLGPPTPHAPSFSQLAQGFKSILCPVNASNSCSNLLCSACPSRVYSHCPLWKSYLNGPLTGDDSHICLLGVCLLITKVPRPPNFTVNTPCCVYMYREREVKKRKGDYILSNIIITYQITIQSVSIQLTLYSTSQSSSISNDSTYTINFSR